MATVWITKYALTQGVVQKAEGCEIKDLQGTTYATRKSGHCTHPDYVFVRLGKEAFVDEAEAKEDVRRRIQRRLKALDKERAKLLELQRGFNSSG